MNHYLTTPIYYASGAPHLGHAYTTLIADCYKRFYQLKREPVRLVSGTDEHGQKIERTAAAAGVPIVEFVGARAHEFQHLWQALDVGIDAFERTTSASHIAFAQAFWQRLVANGDIYLAEYQGLYCVDCEQYFGEAEAGETCPVHRRPLESFAEPSYFFRLGRYQERLIAHIEAHDDFILPVARRNEVLGFLKGQVLKDLAVSRTSTRWGVPVPGDKRHVQYVWVDALCSYLSALSQDRVCDLADPAIPDWWQHCVHFIGKDILTFHAVYWPALLWSAGLPLPQSLIVNGWLTVEGRKIAKSDPSTIIDPIAVCEDVGRDGFKLYLLKAVTLGQDIDFSHDHLVRVINADLANNIGNLFSRFSALGVKRLGGQWQASHQLTVAEHELQDKLKTCAGLVEAGFNEANLAQSARQCIEAASAINAYIQQQSPWEITDNARLGAILSTIHHALSDLTILATPFLPDTAAAARKLLCLEEKPAWQDLGREREQVSVRQGPPLYQRRSP